jgi:hypothetical protein
MKIEKPIVKTRLRVNKNYDLCHHIIIQNIMISNLPMDGSFYHVDFNRKREKGHLLFKLSINKDKLNNKNVVKMGCVTVSKSDGYIQISMERIISNKSIKLQEGHYRLEYQQGTELKVFYSILKKLL